MGDVENMHNQRNWACAVLSAISTEVEDGTLSHDAFVTGYIQPCVQKQRTLQKAFRAWDAEVSQA